ncbi:thioesterase II family protein [Burkholderia gladioli]|uniref:thioesterase II family protein n=1 Tax=Burkholderia gladioli TaxID=28095 RepID=UPI00068B1C03|nr:alpha/beta fold hydrolase [Burkholderia gladioli]
MEPHSTAARAWLAGLEDKPAASLTLLCFGAAGSGGSQFMAWNRQLPPWLRVVAVQLPGRERRHREPPFTRLDALADALAAAIEAARLEPFACFGHSFGALLAYETIRALRRAGGTQACHLCVVGRDAPHLSLAYAKTYHLPDAELVAILRQHGAFDARLLDAMDLLRFFLPLIRADLEMNTEYVHRCEPPLTLPLTALRGTDDPVCDSTRLQRWSELTTGRFDERSCSGDHFFFRARPAELFEILSATLAPYADRSEEPASRPPG